jgi:hypothetical protein
MCNARICSSEPSSVKLDGPVSEIGGSEISMTSDKTSETTITDPDDWRTPLAHYLESPCHIANRNVCRQTLKYVMLDNNFYRRTIDDLLLKCLGLDQSKIVMVEVH